MHHSALWATQKGLLVVSRPTGLAPFMIAIQDCIPIDRPCLLPYSTTLHKGAADKDINKERGRAGTRNHCVTNIIKVAEAVLATDEECPVERNNVHVVLRRPTASSKLQKLYSPQTKNAQWSGKMSTWYPNDDECTDRPTASSKLEKLSSPQMKNAQWSGTMCMWYYPNDDGCTGRSTSSKTKKLTSPQLMTAQ